MYIFYINLIYCYSVFNKKKKKNNKKKIKCISSVKGKLETLFRIVLKIKFSFCTLKTKQYIKLQIIV